jgi:hypothetical protein
VIRHKPEISSRRHSPTKEERDLVDLREEAELAKLPDAERRACQVLWTDVDMLLKKANASAPAVMPQSGHK